MTYSINYPLKAVTYTEQKLKFSIKDFSSKSDQICRKLRTWSHWLEKSLMANFIFWNHWVAPQLTQPLIILRSIKWISGTPFFIDFLLQNWFSWKNQVTILLLQYGLKDLWNVTNLIVFKTLKLSNQKMLLKDRTLPMIIKLCTFFEF